MTAPVGRIRTFCRNYVRSFAALAMAWLACAAFAAGGPQLRPLDGEAAPALVLKDLNGATHDLKQYRGSVVLINFWATWCEPCRHEMPSIERLREKLAGERFVALAVNVDEPHARVRRFVQQTKLSLPVLVDTNKTVTRAWNVRVLPTTYIVGPDGRLHYRLVGDIDWSSNETVGTISRLLPPQ